jgi:hypothetical protein
VEAGLRTWIHYEISLLAIGTDSSKQYVDVFVNWARSLVALRPC